MNEPDSAGLPAQAATSELQAAQERELQLRAEVARLSARVNQLEAASVSADRSHLATLNVLEDAVQARRRAVDATAALQANEERLQLILRSARDYAIFTIDLERRVTSWNAGAEAILGYREEEILGQRADITFVPEDRAQGAPSREVEIAAREGRAENERWHLRQDGVRFYGSGLVQPLRDGSGHPLGFVKIMRDLTEQIRVQDALKANEGLLRAMADNLPGGAAFIVDRDLRYLLAGGEALGLTGLTSAHFEGKTVAEVLPPEVAQNYARHYRRAMAGEPFQTEHRDRGRIFLTHGTALHDSDGKVRGALAVSYDITERKSSEEALQASESRLRLAVEAGRIGTCDWDYQAGVMRWNEERFRLHGLEPRPDFLMTFAEFNELVHPDDRERVQRQIRSGVELHGLHAEEYRTLWSDGSVHWLTETGRVMEWTEGRPLRVLSVVFDVTTRHEAEAATRASEERFRAIVDQTSAGITLLDLECRVTFVNQRLAEMLRSTPVALAGRLVEELTHPDDRPLHQRLLGNLKASGAAYQVDTRLRCEDGRVIWVNVSGSPVRSDLGAVISIIAVVVEITAQKEAQEALRSSEERLRMVLESARDFAIFTLDEQDTILSWNPGAEALFGYQASEIIGTSGQQLSTPEDRERGRSQEAMQVARREGRALDERWHRRKDGSTFWGSGSLVPLRLGSGDRQRPGFLMILRDQTAAREAQRALEDHRQQLWLALQETERARAAAEAAGRAKGHFLAVLSHELRTPLTPVLMAVRTLSRMPDLPPLVSKTLEMIKRNVQLEAHFIDDLLDLTRIENGKLELQLETMDLHEALRCAVEIAKVDFESKQQQLHVHLEAAEHTLLGDPNRLRQVFWNILKNASKFTPRKGSVHLQTRLEPGASGTPARIVVMITDTGIGFDAEQSVRIFEAFTQASVKITREFGGLGLGLAISKATVDASGGLIRAESPGRGQGATFTVELPFLPDPAP